MRCLASRGVSFGMLRHALLQTQMRRFARTCAPSGVLCCSWMSASGFLIFHKSYVLHQLPSHHRCTASLMHHRHLMPSCRFSGMLPCLYQGSDVPPCCLASMRAPYYATSDPYTCPLACSLAFRSALWRAASQGSPPHPAYT